MHYNHVPYPTSGFLVVDNQLYSCFSQRIFRFLFWGRFGGLFPFSRQLPPGDSV
jgi:hypothetical protein